jgi:hypothetical protein
MNQLFNPIKTSSGENTAVLHEIETTGANYITPGETFTHKGEKYEFSNDEYAAMRADIAEKSGEELNSLIETDYYQSLEDEDKNYQIESVQKEINKEVRDKYKAQHLADFGVITPQEKEFIDDKQDTGDNFDRAIQALRSGDEEAYSKIKKEYYDRYEPQRKALQKEAVEARKAGDTQRYNELKKQSTDLWKQQVTNLKRKNTIEAKQLIDDNKSKKEIQVWFDGLSKEEKAYLSKSLNTKSNKVYYNKFKNILEK